MPDFSKQLRGQRERQILSCRPLYAPNARSATTSARKLRFAALATLALVILGIARASAQDNPEPAKDSKVFRQDFRGKGVNEQYFKYSYPGAPQLIHEEPEGLRISLPGENPKPDPTGISLKFPIRGDFELTTSYELLKVEPAGGFGSGVQIWIQARNPMKNAAMLARYDRRGENMYLCQHMEGDKPATRRYSVPVIVPTEAKSGKLRMTRRGTVLTCSASEGDKPEFQELATFDMVTEDLDYARVAVENGKTTAAIEARILDIEVRTPEALIPAANDLLPAAIAPEKKGWLGIAVLLTIVFMVSLGLAGWLYMRSKQKPEVEAQSGLESDAPRPLDVPAPPVTVHCSGCGKTLRGKPELAGKRIKCPQCGSAVLVPKS